MTTPFDRDDTETAQLSPPFAALFAFLSDIHEQVEMQLQLTSNPAVTAVLGQVKSGIEAAGLIVRQLGQTP